MRARDISTRERIEASPDALAHWDSDRELGMKPKRHKPQPPERHQWFDQWMVAAGAPLRQLVEKTQRLLGDYEKHSKVRRRRRRPIDDARHRTSINVVVSNLAYAVLMPPPKGRLAVLLGNKTKGRTRYDNPALGTKPFRDLLRRLGEVQVLDLQYPRAIRGEASTIAPTPWFAKRVQEAGISFADFGRERAEETILLNRNIRSSYMDAAKPPRRERIDYRETAQTRAYRSELRRLNRFLQEADIQFIEDGLKPRVNPFERTLRRYFVLLSDQPERFDQSGRLFGGFWLALKSARRRNIRINSEGVATLDYGSMFTRLAYARLGSAPPPGDVYTIDGAQGYRSGIKMAMNVLLFDTGPHRRSWPRAIGVGVGNDDDAVEETNAAASFDARLPQGWTVAVTKRAILKKHPALKHAWGRGLGYSLMFIESQVLLRALTRLMDEGVPALGLHDGLLVQSSKAKLARGIMREAVREVAGTDIPVEMK